MHLCAARRNREAKRLRRGYTDADVDVDYSNHAGDSEAQSGDDVDRPTTAGQTTSDGVSDIYTAYSYRSSIPSSIGSPSNHGAKQTNGFPPKLAHLSHTFPLSGSSTPASSTGRSLGDHMHTPSHTHSHTQRGLGLQSRGAMKRPPVRPLDFSGLLQPDGSLKQRDSANASPNDSPKAYDVSMSDQEPNVFHVSELPNRLAALHAVKVEESKGEGRREEIKHAESAHQTEAERIELSEGTVAILPYPPSGKPSRPGTSIMAGNTSRSSNRSYSKSGNSNELPVSDAPSSPHTTPD